MLAIPPADRSGEICTLHPDHNDFKARPLSRKLL
jgi:hypothetical protein